MKAQIKLTHTWHKIFGRMGHIVSTKPTTIDQKTAQARVDFIKSELDEYLTANKEGNLVGVLKEITDILYFVFGTVVIHGLGKYMIYAFDIVHRSNMSKKTEFGDVLYDKETGKVLKPDNYKKAEPELEELLKG